MKILAIESSGLVASVAVATENTLVAEYTVNFKATHSQTLLPMVDEVISMIGMDLNEIDAIAVSAGPGSYTGLRIGSATAKGLGLALKKPIIEVPTTCTIAANIYSFEGIICPLMDARRNQVYTGLYKFDEDELKVVSEQEATQIESIIAKINEQGEKTVFLGDGVEVYKEYITDNVKVPYSFAPLHLSKQRAGSLAYVGVKMYSEGKYVSAAEHYPNYLRLSQAERELNERTSGQ